MSGAAPKAILFDLDGTLMDTAPDLVAALNRLRLARNLPAREEAEVRPVVSGGARAILGRGMDDHCSPQQAGTLLDALMDEYLALYRAHLFDYSRLFAGFETLLPKLPIPWGIVTNKAEAYALPLLRQAGLFRRSACLVCGDTLSQSKPHPAPLQLAASILQLDARDLIYLGDAEKDLQAARSAGMIAAWAGWGYGGSHPESADMADIIFNKIQELEEYLEINSNAK